MTLEYIVENWNRNSRGIKEIGVIRAEIKIRKRRKAAEYRKIEGIRIVPILSLFYFVFLS